MHCVIATCRITDNAGVLAISTMVIDKTINLLEKDPIRIDALSDIKVLLRN